MVQKELLTKALKLISDHLDLLEIDSEVILVSSVLLATSVISVSEARTNEEATLILILWKGEVGMMERLVAVLMMK